MEVPKLKPYRNADYLKYVRSSPCGACGIAPPSQAHHVRRSYWLSGLSVKPHDYVAVPRCEYCHKKLVEYDVEREIIKLLMEYIELKRKL